MPNSRDLTPRTFTVYECDHMRQIVRTPEGWRHVQRDGSLSEVCGARSCYRGTATVTGNHTTGEYVDRAPLRVLLRYAPVWAGVIEHTPPDGKVEEWWQTEVGNAGRRNERGIAEPSITVCGRVDMILRAHLGRVRGEVDELTVEVIGDAPGYKITQWVIEADGSVPDGLTAALDPWKSQTLAWTDEINAAAAEHRRQTQPGGPDANAWGTCSDCGKPIHYRAKGDDRFDRAWFHDDGSIPRDHRPCPPFVSVEED